MCEEMCKSMCTLTLPHTHSLLNYVKQVGPYILQQQLTTLLNRRQFDKLTKWLPSSQKKHKNYKIH